MKDKPMEENESKNEIAATMEGNREYVYPGHHIFPQKSKGKVAIYARVSTKEQETENQLIEMRRWMTGRGYEIEEFVDRGYSGSLTEEKRPALLELMTAARKHRFKMVAVWDFSRFARSLKQLILALEEFRNLGINFTSYQQNIDTSTASGNLMFQMIASLAEFERAMIRERVFAGLNRARSQGKVLGRPFIPIEAEKILQLKSAGKSIRAIGLKTGFSRGKIFRTLQLLSRKP